VSRWGGETICWTRYVPHFSLPREFQSTSAKGSASRALAEEAKVRVGTSSTGRAQARVHGHMRGHGSSGHAQAVWLRQPRNEERQLNFLKILLQRCALVSPPMFAHKVPRVSEGLPPLGVERLPTGSQRGPQEDMRAKTSTRSWSRFGCGAPGAPTTTCGVVQLQSDTPLHQHPRSLSKELRCYVPN